MHMSSYAQGENCVYQAHWEAHGQTCMSIYRGWASLMSYISQEKVPFHKNKSSLSSVGLKETCIQASETCLKVSPNEDNLSGKGSGGGWCSVKPAASGRLQLGLWANSGFGNHALVSEPLCWLTSVFVSFLVSAELQTQLREHIYSLFSKQWSANQEEPITKKSPANLIEATPSLIILLPHTSMCT